MKLLKVFASMSLTLFSTSFLVSCSNSRIPDYSTNTYSDWVKNNFTDSNDIFCYVPKTKDDQDSTDFTDLTDLLNSAKTNISNWGDTNGDDYSKKHGKFSLLLTNNMVYNHPQELLISHDGNDVKKAKSLEKVHDYDDIDQQFVVYSDKGKSQDQFYDDINNYANNIIASLKSNSDGSLSKVLMISENRMICWKWNVEDNPPIQETSDGSDEISISNCDMAIINYKSSNNKVTYSVSKSVFSLHYICVD